MDRELKQKAGDIFAFSSSVAGDAWRAGKSSKAYEWWYFDALSDDGGEAIVLTFLDNFVYSPRYNRANARGSTARFPALAFSYFRDGKPLYRTMLEFPESSFDASENEPSVHIGHNSMTFRRAPYGSGYHIVIDAPLSGGRRLRANFEWLAIEADFEPGRPAESSASHCWNLVAPRCDVTGKVAVCDRKGVDRDVFQPLLAELKEQHQIPRSKRSIF